MVLYVKEYCIRCGMCEDLYPEIFQLNVEEDRVEIKYDVIPPELEGKARDAIRDCAIAAIFIQK